MLWCFCSPRSLAPSCSSSLCHGGDSAGSNPAFIVAFFVRAATYPPCSASAGVPEQGPHLGPSAGKGRLGQGSTRSEGLSRSELRTPTRPVPTRLVNWVPARAALPGRPEPADTGISSSCFPECSTWASRWLAGSEEARAPQRGGYNRPCPFQRLGLGSFPRLGSKCPPTGCGEGPSPKTPPDPKRV